MTQNAHVPARKPVSAILRDGASEAGRVKWSRAVWNARFLTGEGMAFPKVGARDYRLEAAGHAILTEGKPTIFRGHWVVRRVDENPYKSSVPTGSGNHVPAGPVAWVANFQLGAREAGSPPLSPKDRECTALLCLAAGLKAIRARFAGGC